MRTSIPDQQGRRYALLRWTQCVAILAAPSLLLMATQPPWWRDSDAFFQVTSPVSHLTVIHWPPLYCLASRLIMRYAGAGGPLSDRGTWALVLAQHAMLVASNLCLVGVVSERWTVRMGAALFLAACPIAPFFAHCVGTEALSIISVYAFAASVVWVLRIMPADRWWHWAVCSATLFVCLQSRHVNLLYAGLPVLAMMPYVRRGNLAPGPVLKATAWSLVALAASSAFVHLLCVRYRIDPVSSLGYTFQWRMKEMQRQPPGEVHAFVERITARLPPDDTETRRALADWNASSPVKVVDMMNRDVQRMLREQGHPDAYSEARRRLNRLAGLVLFPPDPTYVKSVVRDFCVGMAWPLGRISLQPVFSTAQLFDMLGADGGYEPPPGIQRVASLCTFSKLSKAEVLASRSTGWIAFWTWPWHVVPLGGWLLGAVAASVAAGRSRDGSRAAASIRLLAWGFLGVGILIWLANCMLTFFGSRFGIPLWQNAQIAMLLSVDLVARARRTDSGQDRQDGAVHGDVYRRRPDNRRTSNRSANTAHGSAG